MPALRLYNSLGRELQEFKPIVPGKVGFYGCGPTVYNYAHIGNLRAYVFDDTVARSLRFLGYEVKHVMNVTDVGHLTGDEDETGEDKMVKSARERGKSVLDVAAFYTEAFFNDTKRLNILVPDVVCKATEHIEDMVALIKKIEERGFTYQAGGNLYFDVTRFAGYGELALLNLEDLKAGARVEIDQNKRNPADFALWFTKSKFENQALVWDSPWGRGYPGWHIECSAMSMKYLGKHFDIHAGGIDHIPVHHTNEIAQAESATGEKFVNYWLHNEFLVTSSGKMAKSKGGFLTLQVLVDNGYDPLDYRYFLLGGHYRSQLQFSYEALDSAKASRKSLVERIIVLKDKAGASSAGEALGAKASSYIQAFIAHICNDFATPRALAELWGLVRDDGVPPAEALEAVRKMDEVLGLNLGESRRLEAPALDPALAREVDRLVAERGAAKKAKDWARADAIRAELKSKGVLLEDGPNGTAWRLG